MLLHFFMKSHWTGDDVVDAVLNNKIQFMENRKIRYEIQTDFPDKTGIEAADLCTILANLLDNAIEATGKLPEQTAPLKIRIQSIKKFVLIEISNPSKEIKFFLEKHANHPSTAGAYIM